MRHPRLSPRTKTRLAILGTVVGLVGGVLFLVAWVVGLARTADPAPLDANVGDQIAAAAVFALHAEGVDGFVARRYQDETGTRWQVSLVDGTRRCWKVQVAYEAHAAVPVGRPAPVGCWPLPDVGSGVPAGDADLPDRDADAAARGFLDAYLTGGLLKRWVKPGVDFPQPAPLDATDFGLLDSHQNGDMVSVNGWVNAATTHAGAARVDTTWRVTLVPGDTGLVVSKLDAGPPPPRREETPGPTVAPTTSTTVLTTTTAHSGATSTTAGRE